MDNMSMAYERHTGDYDTRFEPNYRKGYNTCWKHQR